MILSVQINSLVFSLIFGILLNFLFEWFNRFNDKNKIIMRILLSIVFVLMLSLLYFIGLLYINNGYLHLYFFLFILVGYIIVYFIKTFWFTHKKENSKM